MNLGRVMSGRGVRGREGGRLLAVLGGCGGQQWRSPLTFAQQWTRVTDLAPEPIVQVKVGDSGQRCLQLLTGGTPVGVGVLGASDVRAEPGDQREPAFERPHVGGSAVQPGKQPVERGLLAQAAQRHPRRLGSARSRCSSAVRNAAAVW